MMFSPRNLIKQSLYNVGYYHLLARRNSGGTPRLLVLFYHNFRDQSSSSPPGAFDVFNPSGAHFEAHLKEIANNYRIVGLRQGLEEVRDGTLQEDSVAITFDDGFESVYNVAFPLLKKYNAPATLFVITDWINSGRPQWWNVLREMFRQSEFQGFSALAMEDALGMSCGVDFDSRPPRPDDRRRMIDTIETGLRDLADSDRADRIDRLCALMFPSGRFEPEVDRPLNWDQIHEMSAGKMTIESHTCSHISFRHTDVTTIESEILVSKNEIESRLQREVTGLAYPYGKDLGAYSVVHPLLKRIGFKYACTTCPGIVSADSDPFSLGRNGLPLSSVKSLIHRTLILHFAQPHLNASA